MPSSAQVSFAEAIAREKDIAIPDEARICAAEMSAWIDANRQPKPAKGRKTSAAGKRASTAKGKKTGTKTPGTGKSASAAERVAQPGDARTGPQTGTPLRFPTETRRLRSSSVPDTRQAAGMRLPASILWHSASVSGCDLGPHSMIYPTDGVPGRLAAYLCAGWLPRLLAPKTRHGRHSRLHGATASCRSNFVLLNRPRISTVP